MTSNLFAHLRRALPARFPKLFAGRDEPLTQNLMAFGMDCGNGWLPLIEASCEAIAAVPHDPAKPPKFVQVKEKFGSLRIYLQGPQPAHRIAQFADIISHRVCETCGAPGRATVHDSWHQTLCPAHAAENAARLLGPDHFKVPRIWDAPPTLAVLQARWPCLATTRMIDIPPGWLDVLDAFGEEQDRRGNGASCRQIARTSDGHVEIDWPGINEEGEAALSLLAALLPKLDPATGALRAGEGA